ncbi:hypothetical protein [Amycolatopsis tolypomycina]|uniref:hypothetical protein n=1 Tax=Amycolatopsis tolypomycina TaxID=208445 RepID=UPI0033B0D9D8
MKLEAYVEVKPGTDISHDLLPADEKIEIQIGSIFAEDDSTLRLSFSDPESLTALAKIAIEARTALMMEQRRQLDSAERNGQPERVVFFPTFDQLDCRQT